MKKVLVLILAYNAEKHIVGVLNRLPDALWHNPEYEAEVVVIDDGSRDHTSAVAREHFKDTAYPIRLLRNPVNQGYGGNQKIGYAYAIAHGYDAVVMLHGDGQYPPEIIPDMVLPLVRGEADAVFGSRMLNKRDALKGGMPRYKFVGNIVLTTVQNLMLGSRLSEFHTGFRAYSVAALKRIPFECNSNVFHFDTDIIIQFIDQKFTIKEIPIPTFYGDEICHVSGMRYAFDVMVSTLLSRIQKYGIFYAPKFDYGNQHAYSDKSRFASSHRFALEQVAPGERVLSIDCGERYVAGHLRAQGSYVAGCAVAPDALLKADYDTVYAMDFDHPDFRVLNGEHPEVILLLDVLERMQSPESYLAALHAWCVQDNPRILVTAPNIAFIIQRLMLFFGQFNYGKRGTLDMTHTRLFTFGSLRRLLSNAGFTIVKVQGIPAPFPVALGENWRGHLLLRLNSLFIRLSKTLFSYQIAMVARPMPTLEWLVQQAVLHGEESR